MYIYKSKDHIFKKLLLKNIRVLTYIINEFPRSQIYSTTELFGYNIRILEAFADYLHIYFGALMPESKNRTEKSFHVELYNAFGSDIDFTMNFDLFMLNFKNLHETQRMSTVLEWMPWMIIVPVPQPISLQDYIVKVALDVCDFWVYNDYLVQFTHRELCDYYFV